MLASVVTRIVAILLIDRENSLWNRSLNAVLDDDVVVVVVVQFSINRNHITYMMKDIG